MRPGWLQATSMSTKYKDRSRGLTPLTEILRRELPLIKVLILSGHPSTRFVLRILQAGARGYLLKDASAKEMLEAIQAVAAGGTCFGPEFARVALEQMVQKNGT